MSAVLDANALLLSDGSSTTMKSQCQGKPCVIDFWHSNCSRCPAALEKVNRLAPKYPNICFLACALSQGANNFDVTSELVQDTWENLIHCFVEVEAKEAIKLELELSSVPYYLICDKDGNVLVKGEPKSVNLEEWLAKLSSAESNTSSSGLKMDEDF